MIAINKNLTEIPDSLYISQHQPKNYTNRADCIITN